jgi:hypothetical protein
MTDEQVTASNSAIIINKIAREHEAQANRVPMEIDPAGYHTPAASYPVQGHPLPETQHTWPVTNPAPIPDMGMTVVPSGHRYTLPFLRKQEMSGYDGRQWGQSG